MIRIGDWKQSLRLKKCDYRGPVTIRASLLYFIKIGFLILPATLILAATEDKAMDQLTAQVILCLPDGSSPLDKGPPGSEGFESLQPSAKTFNEATKKLKELGFTVEQPGATGLTIVGDKATFERAFKIKIERQSGQGGLKNHWSLSGPFRVPKQYKAWLADLVFSIEPEFFP